MADELRTLIAAERHPYLVNGDFSRERQAIQTAYAHRQYQPLWTRNREIAPHGIALLQTLRAAGDYGLQPDDYDGTQLIYHAVDLITDRSASAARWAELDVGMSIAAARLVKHLHFGRVDPRAAGFDSNTPRAPFDVAAVLERLASSEDVATAIASVEPAFMHYQLVKRALQRYRLLAVERELTQLPAFKTRSIKLGESYDGIPALRRLLIALGDLAADTATSDIALDETLASGIRRFQQRHGLAIDGALGRNTFAALTTPLSTRAEQLALTLERWRWLPEFDSPPIVVNIPPFRLFAFSGAEDRAADMLQMDVIVGQTYPATRTPAFTAEMNYVVFRPYWDVPTSILSNEMLPEIRVSNDMQGYFDRNKLEIVSSSDANAAPVAPSAEAIEQLAAGKLRLRQRPGADNSLGLVKLMFPNPYNVYLHSTPARRLFAAERRAFSHGCIRVSDPAGLVEHVLRGVEGNWTRETIEAAMNDDSPAGDNRHVFLNKPIPVLIVYGTAMALESGEVQFFEDIYGHDRKLQRLLKAKSKN